MLIRPIPADPRFELAAAAITAILLLGTFVSLFFGKGSEQEDVHLGPTERLRRRGMLKIWAAKQNLALSEDHSRIAGVFGPATVLVSTGLVEDRAMPWSASIVLPFPLQDSPSMFVDPPHGVTTSIRASVDAPATIIVSFPARLTLADLAFLERVLNAVKDHGRPLGDESPYRG